MKQKQLYHKSFGSGEPIIILHGLLGMSDNWASIAKKLSENYTVFTLDQRDHGRSPHSDKFNYELLSEDVLNFMEENWIYRATLIGHSMGGKTAMQLAHDHPDLVKKMVIVDIGPGKYNGGHEEIFDALLSINLSKIKKRQEVEDLLIDKLRNKRIVLFLLKNLGRNKNDGFKWKVNLPLLAKSYPNILAQLDIHEINIPTLFIKGSDSDYIDEANIDLISDLFLDNRIKELSNAGHWVHADQPKAFYNCVIEFLQ